MSLSPKTQHVAIHLEIPSSIAWRFFGHHDDPREGRHQLEKLIQNFFYDDLKMEDAFVANGDGTLQRGSISILTDRPAKVLPALKEFFETFDICGKQKDFLPFITLAWLDESDRIYRTYYPLTTRPFYTFGMDPKELENILKRGRALREQQTA